MVLAQELGFIAKSTNTVEAPDALRSPIDEENARIKRRYYIREADFYDNRKFPEEFILKKRRLIKVVSCISNCYNKVKIHCIQKSSGRNRTCLIGETRSLFFAESTSAAAPG